MDHTGAAVPEREAERARSLVIPPAWREVWIAKQPNAHIQAVGTDEAGRRQYTYHADWSK
ncbi:DNA topoisomerase IB, partial [Acinetobacter baumannii]